MNLEKYYMEEDLFPREITSFEEKDYGILFYNDENKDSFDSNHAIIYREKVSDLSAVLYDIINFYKSKGITPNIYQSINDDGYFLEIKEEMAKDALSRSIEIVRRRIDALGTKEPSIQSQGGKYILVQLPGVDNPERIKELIGQTAKMTFHLVNESVSAEQVQSGRAPAGTEFLPYIDAPDSIVPVYSRVEVSGESLKDSQADFDQHNMPVVSTVFDASGARRFAKLTTEHVNERFAIVLDGKVLSAPVIR